METPVTLVPLRCLRCSTPVPAEADEVAWVCRQCGQGLLLDEQQGLVPLEVHYASGIDQQALGRPFWVVEGHVALKRDAYGTFGRKGGEADRYWQTPRRFFIPAFSGSLDDLLQLAAGLTQKPPEITTGKAADFEPVILAPQDVPGLVEFLVMSIEAERKDSLKQLSVSAELGKPGLWILPR